MTQPALPRRTLLAGLGLIAAGQAHAQSDTARIAAASDLGFVLEEIATRFRAETGHAVQLTFGSSGNFARQLQQGAPFDLFLSADEGFVFQLADAGRTRDRGALYAEGRIALFAPTGSPLAVDADFAGLRTALAAGRIRRFAIANPEHAPYGRAAEQALKGQGLWDALRPLLVLGENVSQAAQFATSGAAEGGIIAQSLALAPAVATRGRSALLPAEFHAPLRQRMVLMRDAGPAARAFYAYLRTRPARLVLERYGFTLTSEAV